MVAIGIDIDSSKIILYALKDENGHLENITGSFKTLAIVDEYENSQIREFQATIHSFFDTLNPDKIGILKRNTKGRYSASPTSFKLEGLIQCYDKCEIEFISPKTISAFFTKNDFVNPSHKYQIEASKLAQYLLS